MSILARIIITILILSSGGFCIGMLWGLYLGERENIMKLNKIKIKDSFKKTEPAGWKMRERWIYYRQMGKLYSPILVNRKGYLIDGYTSYLIAKEDGLKEVEVVRR